MPELIAPKIADIAPKLKNGYSLYYFSICKSSYYLIKVEKNTGLHTIDVPNKLKIIPNISKQFNPSLLNKYPKTLAKIGYVKYKTIANDIGIKYMEIS